MTKIRTIFLLGNLSIGGSETKVVRLANRLAAAGHEIHLIALGAPHTLLDQLDESVSVRCFERSSRFSIRNLLRLKNYLVSIEVDSIVCVNPYPLIYGWPVSLLSATNRPACIASINTSDLLSKRDRYFMHLYAFILRRCDRVIFGARRQAEAWRERYGIVEGKSSVIYNGVDSDYFEVAAGESSVSRQSLGISNDSPVIGCVAQFRPEKSHSTLIDAVGRLNRRHQMNVVLVLVGEGPEEEKVLNRARELGIEEYIRMVGQVDDVRPYLSLMDVFALASVSVEVFSNAVLEAMAMGVVPVCSDIGGAREMIDHGEDGFIFPPGNVDSLEQYLLELLTNGELTRRLGLRAWRKVREKFTVEVMDREYVNLLTSVESG